MSIAYTPRTWTSGETVTAAMMNTEVRDFSSGVQAAWTTYTPTWTATTTNPVVNNGVQTGRFNRAGKSIDVSIAITLGTTTTIGSGTYIFAVPVTTVGIVNQTANGTGAFFDTSGGVIFGGYAPTWFSTSAVIARNPSGAVMSSAAPVVPATGDIISHGLRYETT